MSPLESVDRHTASSQKLLTSKQPTPHSVPALAPSLSSDLIPPSPQSLNLVSQHLLDRTQTEDSNFVDITTIDNRYKGKAPLDGVGEEAVFEGQNTPFDMDSFRSHTYLGRGSRYAPRLATLGIQWFRPIRSLGIEWSPPVEDIDILHTDSGQPLFSQESTPSFTVKVSTFGVGEEAIFHTSPSPRLPTDSSSSPSFPVRRSDAPPFFSPGCSDDDIFPTPPSSTSPRSDDGDPHSVAYTTLDSGRKEKVQ